MLVHRFIRVEKNIVNLGTQLHRGIWVLQLWQALREKKQKEMLNVWKQFFFRRNKEKKRDWNIWKVTSINKHKGEIVQGEKDGEKFHQRNWIASWNSPGLDWVLKIRRRKKIFINKKDHLKLKEILHSIEYSPYNMLSPIFYFLFPRLPAAFFVHVFISCSYVWPCV